MKSLKLKYSLVRQDRIDGTEYIIAKFGSEGDALWAATLFASHKVIGERYNCYVTDGKRFTHPSTAIPLNCVRVI